MVDRIQPKDPCTTSMASCIEAVCREEKSDVTWESWAGRAIDVFLLSNIDASLEGRTHWSIDQIRTYADTSREPVLQASEGHPTEPARIREIRTTTVWGSPETISDAEALRHSEPTEKASFRRLVAQFYLQANPDFCKPPDQLPDAATFPGKFQIADNEEPVQLVSSEPPVTSFGRPMIGGMIFPMGNSWVNDAAVAGGASVTGATAVYGIATALEWAAANWFVWVWAL